MLFLRECQSSARGVEERDLRVKRNPGFPASAPRVWGIPHHLHLGQQYCRRAINFSPSFGLSIRHAAEPRDESRCLHRARCRRQNTARCESVWRG